MKKRKESYSKTQNIDSRIIKRLRIYLLVMFILLVVIVFEVLNGRFSILFSISGIIIGLLIGIIVSRVYNLSWDEEANNVIGKIDWIGAVILVCYLIFIFTKTQLLGYWVQGNSLFAMVLGITAGTMLGRVMSTERGIKKVLKVLEI
jgi:membrane associated rhomboid family serine protease